MPKQSRPRIYAGLIFCFALMKASFLSDVELEIKRGKVWMGDRAKRPN
jgi:hypothetical protein